ncbi:MAG: DUF1934 domain-containing protein [Oscillospiraceae bacterium]|nr:DUF1934 domain-containing protein [Oscillospiraceae bacterium]
MKKDAFISIRGVYSIEDDQDVVELFTTGKFYKKNGCYFISYDESEATGYDGSKTTLKVDSDRMVTLERTGSAKSQLIVERGVRHQCCYSVGLGDLTVGVLGNRIKSSLTDNGGNLEIKYSLDINALYASENEMFIRIDTSSHGAKA